MSAATSTSRRWYQLHRSTYVICLLEAVLLIVLIVPGDIRPDPEADNLSLLAIAQRGIAHEPIAIESPVLTLTNVGSGAIYYYEHGWPWPYLDYASRFERKDPAWMALENWSHSGRWYGVRIGALIADMVVALLMVITTATVCDWRRRRRASFWQVTLRGIFAATFVIAAGLAWWENGAWSAQREASALAAIRAEELYGHIDFSTRFDAPRWLTKLAGRRCLRCFVRVHEINLSEVDAYEMEPRGRPQLQLDGDLSRIGPHLGFLEKVERFTIHRSYRNDSFNVGTGGTDRPQDPMPHGFSLEYLNNLPNLRSLSVCDFQLNDKTMPYIRRLTNLRCLRLAKTGVTNAGLAQLRGLKELRTLDVSCLGISDDGLEHLAALTTLEELNLRNNPAITDTGLAKLRNLNHLRILDLCDTGISDDGLEHLASLPMLAVVDLGSNQAITDAGLRRLARLVNLREIDLTLTGVTEQGIADLKRAQPELKVSTWSGRHGGRFY